MKLNRAMHCFVSLVFLHQAFGLSQVDQPGATVFETASVRPSGPNSPRGSLGGPGTISPRRYSFYSATLLDLITIGWNMERFQVVSHIPLERDAFDVIATIPQGATKQQFRVMIQNLLAARFHLKFHIETRTFPAYDLRTGKKGPKLADAAPTALASGSVSSEGAKNDLEAKTVTPTLTVRHSIEGSYELIQVTARSEPISALVRYLPHPDGAPVLDRTGLNGVYNFNLEYSQPLTGVPPGDSAASPEIFTAVREQLGLELQRTTVPLEVVVVDGVDRTPTEN